MSDRSPRVSARLEITNRLGLHARAARLLVEAVRHLDADLVVAKEDQTVNGKNILELMMLAAGPGTVLEVVACGPEAEAALAAVTRLVAQRFHEAE